METQFRLGHELHANFNDALDEPDVSLERHAKLKLMAAQSRLID
jgi:hypothetical protein